METPIWCDCTMALCGVGLRKGTMSTVCNSMWKKAVPQNSLCCQTLQFLPICHWCPSRYCPSAGAQREWIWLSPYEAPPRGDAWNPVSSINQPTLDFTARIYGDFSWAVWSGVELGFLTPKISLHFISIGFRPASSLSPCLCPSDLLHTRMYMISLIL